MGNMHLVLGQFPTSFPGAEQQLCLCGPLPFGSLAQAHRRLLFCVITGLLKNNMKAMDQLLQNTHKHVKFNALL